MKCLIVRAAVLLCLGACLPAGYAAPLECAANLPAGLVIRVFPDEKLMAGVTSGPTIFTVTSDVRFFPNRPPLLTRGSKVLGTILESKQAGHFWGKAKMRIALTSILTSDFCEYPIDAKVVEAGRYKVDETLVKGKGHTGRDVFFLLFPPTTIYQLLRLPGRGPKLVINAETPLTIKLLQSVSLGQATATAVSENDGLGTLRTKVEQVERDMSSIKAASVAPIPPPSQGQEIARVTSGPCPAANFRASILPITQRSGVVRPVRNLTPYHVSLYLNRAPVGLLPPCYGPTMITTPATEFKLEAVANMLTTGGQTQIGVRIVPDASGNGWDIIPDTGEPIAIRANR